MQKGDIKWQWEITSRTRYRISDVKALWSYRHFLASLVRRRIFTQLSANNIRSILDYFSTFGYLTYLYFRFNKMVGISTESIPPVLFYFSGIVLWNFFSDCWGGTSTTFKDNADLFSKVYFPRMYYPGFCCLHTFSSFSFAICILIMHACLLCIFQRF